jgi:hypothetical protein
VSRAYGVHLKILLPCLSVALTLPVSLRQTAKA